MTLPARRNENLRPPRKYQAVLYDKGCTETTDWQKALLMQEFRLAEGSAHIIARNAHALGRQDVRRGVGLGYYGSRDVVETKVAYANNRIAMANQRKAGIKFVAELAS